MSDSRFAEQLRVCTTKHLATLLRPIMTESLVGLDMEDAALQVEAWGHARTIREHHEGSGRALTEGSLVEYIRGVMLAGIHAGVGPDVPTPEAHCLGMRLVGAYLLLDQLQKEATS